ncbi:MAG: ubiquinol-cytochrome c reductase iron-sulfur subunit [bacterium]
METHEVDKNRRSFLSWLLGGGALALLGAIFYPVFKYVVPPPSGEANVTQLKLPFTLSELIATEGRFKIFKFGKNTGIALVTAAGEVKAFSATCTHLDCLVQYVPEQSVLWCACHNGRYDLQGRNISGPPPRPLEQYEVHLDEASGEIHVAEAQNS